MQLKHCHFTPSFVQVGEQTTKGLAKHYIQTWDVDCFAKMIITISLLWFVGVEINHNPRFGHNIKLVPLWFVYTLVQSEKVGVSRVAVLSNNSQTVWFHKPSLVCM